MEVEPKAQSLVELVRNTRALPAAPSPVERLAFHLGALSRGESGEGKKALREVVALTSDGISAPLLYQSAPELVLSSLGGALSALEAEERVELLGATLWMRPLRDEDVARYAAFSLEAMGFVSGEEPPAPPESEDEKLSFYRWARILALTSVHVQNALETTLAERGLPSTGGTPFETFQEWLGTRAVYIVTPQNSPAALHQLKEAQREDWIDQPWLLGTSGATFTLEEIEEDSSEVNMQDGERVTHWLREQVLPYGDFFVEAYGWLPRTSEETAREEAESRGITILTPAAHDVEPRAVAFDDMTFASRETWGHAVRALAEVRDGELPTDVTLGFFHDTHGQVGAFEIGISNTLKNDGAKNVVRFYFDDDPAPIVAALRRAGSSLEPLSLPKAIAEAHPHCSRVVVKTPGRLYLDVGPEILEAWGYPSDGLAQSRGKLTNEGKEPLSSFVAPALVGHLAVDSEEELEPFRVTLEDLGDTVHAELFLQGTTYAMEVLREGNRVTLRQRDVRPPVTFDGDWDVEKSTLKGLWRIYGMGGTFTLAAEEPIEDVSAEELYESARKGWLERSSVDLEALRFPGELVHLRALFEDDHFRAAYLRNARDRAMRTQSRNLDAQMGVNATEIHPTLMPEPFRALEHATKRLGYQGKVRIWVHNADNVNAFVTEDEGGVTVHLTSGLLESFDEPEMRIVMGHELGHVLFGHHELALGVQGTAMSGATQTRYFALRRHQELTTDRIAMFVSDEPDRMFLVQAMLTTGVRKRSLFGTTSAIVAHAREEVAQLRKRSQSDRKRDTHPYAAMRTVALAHFASYPLLRELGAAGKASASTAPDDELLELSRLLDVPVVEQSAGDADGARRTFLALAALYLAEADGTTSAREIRNVLQIEDNFRPVAFEVLGYSQSRRFVAMLAEARVLCRRLSVPAREELLVKLLGVVKSDNVVAYSESSRFMELGGLLSVDTLSFQKLVDKLYKASR